MCIFLMWGAAPLINTLLRDGGEGSSVTRVVQWHHFSVVTDVHNRDKWIPIVDISTDI